MSLGNRPLISSIHHSTFLQSLLLNCIWRRLTYLEHRRLDYINEPFLFSNKLAAWYRVSLRFRNLLLTNQITPFLSKDSILFVKTIFVLSTNCE